MQRLSSQIKVGVIALILAVLLDFHGVNGFKPVQNMQFVRRGMVPLFMARAAKPIEKDGQIISGSPSNAGGPDDDEMITLPFDGLVGKDQGLFDKALDMMDPIQAEYDSLPGAEGSQERKDAIEKLIKARVAAIQSDNYEKIPIGKNPLQNVPVWEIAWATIKICKPFESSSELFLTYILANTTTFIVGGYVFLVNGAFQSWLKWFIDTDFAGSGVGAALKL